MMKIDSIIPSQWKEFFEEEKKKEYYPKLISKVIEKYENEKVYPPFHLLFSALDNLKPEDVKVIILGQDPYHEENEANGLAFSVSKGVKLPPSLKNIYKELSYEYGYPIPKNNGDLTPWSKQGVLLLNTTLSVKEGEANSHSKIGWIEFTDNLISYLDRKYQGIVYILWGNYANGKRNLILNKDSKIIHTAHPSPLSASRGFLKSNCFKQCNEYLLQIGKKEIDWKISD